MTVTDGFGHVIDPETLALNADIRAKMRQLPDFWSFKPEAVRAARRAGAGAWPLAPKSARARTITIEGRGGPLSLRVIAPEAPAGVYLHLHGGGWMLGQADFQDDRLERLVATTGFACVSVDYRLAPEHPYPAGPDDCESAALWLVREASALFGTTRLVTGGESAGAHLALVTMLRLRDRHGLTPFAGANLIAGCFDLGLTPSARLWGDDRLILTTRDIRLFARGFLANGEDPRDPDISPLYARLEGLPPALISVGTLDALLDDSLFLDARWRAAGNRSELRLWPGGAHVFQAFSGPLTEQASAAETAFFRSLD